VTNQQRADILLRQHQANRASALGLSIVRSEMLKAYYDGEIAQGADALTANERMHAHAAYLDEDYERDLSVLRQVLGRKEP
jgi:hypothetical protein